MTTNYPKSSPHTPNTSRLLLNYQRSCSRRFRVFVYSLYSSITCSIHLFATESAFAAAAATLNFDQGIADGVNPLLRLILTHNGKAIFLSSAIGMLMGGGSGTDGWTRLKMGGMWAIGAAALIHIMKGTLGVAMPG